MLLNKNHILFSIPIISFWCITSLAQISDSANKTGSKYNIMHGNLLVSDNFSKLYLNAGVAKSNNSEFYFLKLDYTHPESVPHIYPGDILVLTIDGIELEVDAYDVKPSQNRTISFYNIDKFDLIDLGNARNVHLKAFGGDQFIEADFSAENIQNMREFINAYIFSEVMVTEQASDKYWGFLGVGGGTSHNVWIGMYLDKLKLNFVPDLSDFGAIGLGYSQFEYERFSYVTDQWQNYYISSISTVKEPIWVVGAIYGITYPINWLMKWSLNIGFVFQYYNFDEKHWEDEKGRLEENPYESYRIVNREPYSGATVGVFIQAGSFWWSINTFGAWTAGVSISIKN